VSFRRLQPPWAKPITIGSRLRNFIDRRREISRAHRPVTDLQHTSYRAAQSKGPLASGRHRRHHAIEIETKPFAGEKERREDEPSPPTTVADNRKPIVKPDSPGKA